MAVPDSLRQADANIYKTAMRAAQLQSVKPIIAYWCEYWILKQILAKGLHNGNADILDYSTELMDKLEETKNEYATEEALTDDVAGQAYVEQFAQETLDRAQRVVKAGKVTATTATTFDAAATFFALVNVWGPPDAETLQKIKYAKWNAARILKAIKDGQDPNETNPKAEDLPPVPAEHESMELDEENDLAKATTAATRPRPATVEDVAAVSGGADLQPPALPPQPHHQRRDSAGVSLPHSPASIASHPTAPAAVEDDDPPVFLPDVPAGSAVDASAPPPEDDAYYRSAPPATEQQPPASAPYSYPYQQTPQPEPSAPPAAPPVVPRVAAAAAPPPQSYAPPSGPAGAVDEEAMANAQKHAKWAISALNFEDVSTAVRELRKALQFLGEA